MTKKEIVTTHKRLAEIVQGKSVLHLNSLGKDAIVCLDWLNNYAKLSKIISVYFELESGYPTDKKYLNYLKKQYPKTQFISLPNPVELNEILLPMFQTPLFINYVINNCEFEEFSFIKIAEETRQKYGLDYLCSGMSCYEGMGRAMYFRRAGLLCEKKKTIYPIGLMKQKQIFKILKNIKTKLNPSYKFSTDSFDTPTYFKMRSAFIAKPNFKKQVYKKFPLLALDEYRYEVLINGKK